jgi:hypothetical protein
VTSRRPSAPRRVHSVAFEPVLDDWIESVVRRLAALGYKRATRSAMVREALGLLQQRLDGRSDGELLRFFVERDVERAMAPVHRLQDVDDSQT